MNSYRPHTGKKRPFVLRGLNEDKEFDSLSLDAEQEDNSFTAPCHEFFPLQSFGAGWSLTLKEIIYHVSGCTV